MELFQLLPDLDLIWQMPQIGTQIINSSTERVLTSAKAEHLQHCLMCITV